MPLFVAELFSVLLGLLSSLVGHKVPHQKEDKHLKVNFYFHHRLFASIFVRDLWLHSCIHIRTFDLCPSS